MDCNDAQSKIHDTISAHVITANLDKANQCKCTTSPDLLEKRLKELVMEANNIQSK